MKFLCPQCKAKYRIADEKLAERASSRMKCRKCGHVIDIHSATVPDDSIPPPGVAVSDLEPSPKEPVGKKATGAVPRVGAGALGGTAPARRAPGAPLGGTPVRRPVGGGTGAGATAAAVKRPVAPPRRGGAAVAQAVAEKAPAPEKAPSEKAPLVAETAPIVDEQPLPTAPAATRPAITRPAASEPPPKSEFEDEPTRIHDGSSLAAAFSSTAGQAVADAAAPPAAPDEWYIGIDGSPLGPISLSVLREKAATRKATFESLVWREGFEEWKPLKEFPELVALVEEARRESGDDHNDLRTIPVPSPLDAQKARAAGSELPSELLDQIGARPKGVSHPAAWTAVIVAIAFGVTIGSVLLSKTEKQEVVKYVEVPASAQASAAPVNDTTTIEESTVSVGNTKKAGSTAQKAEPAPAVTPGKTGLSGLNGLNGLNGLGPATNGPDVAQNANLPGGQLDGTAIQKVVANFTSSVRRGCWDSALAARSPDAPSSARVMVTISIASSGNVDNVTTSGDPKGYPNLAHCIESKVRAWHFPRSSGTTTAQVPFVFAAQ